MPSAPERADHALWLRLALTPGVGPAACQRLLEAFGSPAALFAAPGALPGTVPDPALAPLLSAAQWRALRATDPSREQRIAASLQWAGQPGCRLLTLDEDAYPDALRRLPDPPPVLFVRGDAGRLQGPALAVVGSRHGSAGGRERAHRFARALAQAGLTIVSGLAVGIDAAAHAGALGTVASTIAVIGNGPDRVYPARHRELAGAIAREGVVVSEFAPGEPPLRDHFPRRNRLIAGLSLGVLVVEAARDSGSLITARLALEQGRDVFAIPGSVDSPLSKGCHALLRDGAHLVETVDDVLDVVGWGRFSRQRPPQRRAPAAATTTAVADAPGPSAPAAAGVIDPADTRLLAALGWDPLAADELAARSDAAPAALAASLVRLQLAGAVDRLSDGRYQQVDPARAARP